MTTPTSTPLSQSDFNARLEGLRDYNHILRSLLNTFHLLTERTETLGEQEMRNLLVSIHELSKPHKRTMPLLPGHRIPVLDHGHVVYESHMGSDAEICNAARISYAGKEKLTSPEDNQKLINYLYKNKHTSPFEMAKVRLVIKMPIFVARQYIRHRMQNVNEVSARYTELPDEFYIPEVWREQDTKNKQGSVATLGFDPVLATRQVMDVDGTSYGSNGASVILNEHCRYSYQLYQELITAGVAREMARMVLPLNIYTEMVVCWDLKNLLHFVTLREDAHAQAEIQDYGRAIKSILVQLFPQTMSAYERYKFPCHDTQS
jgi:thymidylate synthase (FAD)